MNRLVVARILLVLGLSVAGVSWWMTLLQLADLALLLSDALEKGAALAGYHVFREACGALTAKAVLLILFFGPRRFRTPESWLTALLIVVGFYAPFWAAALFSEDPLAPGRPAELMHLAVAGLSIAALFLAKPFFQPVKEAARAFRLERRYISGQQIAA